MDVTEWLAVLSWAGVLIVCCAALASGVVGAAIAVHGRLPVVVGVVIGVLAPVLGQVILLVIVLARSAGAREERRRVRASATRTAASAFASDAAGPGGAPGAPSPFAPGTLPGTSFPIVPTTASPFGSGSLPSPLLADPLRGDRSSPAGGGAGAGRPDRTGARATVLRTRLTPAALAPRALDRQGVLSLLVLGLATGALLVTLLVNWFVFDAAVIPALSVGAWGTGIDVAVIASVAALVVCLVLSARRPSTASASLAVLVGSAWTALSGTALLAAAQIVQTLSDVGEFSYSVGELVTTLGLQPGDAALILGDAPIDLSGIDLAAPIPSLSLTLGPAWFVTLAAGLLATIWAIAELVTARRARRR